MLHKAWVPVFSCCKMKMHHFFCFQKRNQSIWYICIYMLNLNSLLVTYQAFSSCISCLSCLIPENMWHSYACEFTVKYLTELEYLLKQKASEDPDINEKAMSSSWKWPYRVCHYFKLSHLHVWAFLCWLWLKGNLIHCLWCLAQIHRRARALRKLAKQLTEKKLALSSKSLQNYIMPYATTAIFSEKMLKVGF